jgi:hypothetical protein
MKSIAAILAILICSFYSAEAQSAGVPQPPEALTSISSTPTGGNWSSPSTWVGGAVPTDQDNVTIAPGATVTIDTVARAANVMVGGSGSRPSAKIFSLGANPARLTFEETSAHTLTVFGSITIGSDGIFSTGAGTVNTHVITINWHLINNGVLDLSTNNGQAGAILKFDIFIDSYIMGTGAVTDVYRIEVAKSVPTALVDLNVSNFSVQGSTTDTAGSGFLVLTMGTFRISGTFACTHRTLANPTISVNTALWLENPNYTIAAQPATITVSGLLVINAGTFNTTGIQMEPTSAFSIYGGSLNSTGSLRVLNPFATTIGGGTIKTCTVSPPSNCLVEFTSNPIMSGGDLVIQNTATYKYDAAPTTVTANNLRGTRLHFGNAQTTSGEFTLIGQAPNVVLDASAITITVNTLEGQVHMNDLNIGPNATLAFKYLNFHGTNIVNNGEMKKKCYDVPTCELAYFNFDDLTGTTDVTYSGMGVVTDYLNAISITARTITFSSSSNIPAYNLTVNYARVVNAAKMTLGSFNTYPTRIDMNRGAILENAPDFRIGSTPQTLTYRWYTNGVTIGPELNPSRNLDVLQIWGPGTVNLTGGDLKVNFNLALVDGAVLKSGSNTVTARFDGASFGYVDGRLRMQVNASPFPEDPDTFPVGSDGRSAPVKITGGAGTNPSYITVRAIGSTLPGLYPPASAARHWQITEEGNLVARIQLIPAPSEMLGDPANYGRYRSNGGAPVLVTETDIDELTGDWGLGVGPVTVSGTITRAGGQPLRNAVATISGGNLPNPVTVVTGSFGSYFFQNLTPTLQYTITVSAKRYRFTPNSRTITPTGNLANINFAANPQE